MSNIKEKHIPWEDPRISIFQKALGRLFMYFDSRCRLPSSCKRRPGRPNVTLFAFCCFLAENASTMRPKCLQAFDACGATDKYCLAPKTRSTFAYKNRTFAANFLHFWSMSAPPMVSLCNEEMARRFTIPGLWSSFAMQSSSFLVADTANRVALASRCPRYAHLLAYAPAVPGGCTGAMQSFFASVGTHGGVHKVSPMEEPDGQPYSGSVRERDQVRLWRALLDFERTNPEGHRTRCTIRTWPCGARHGGGRLPQDSLRLRPRLRAGRADRVG